ncbi:hypothetical protein ZHAS_00019375 [Anopheles sinensis]|uniref:Uncharacterized protein n=1 Tax=Anopheles sinensis TaxID=74873 RepID=A0A084WM77_ANOSI|nr:hypothetical protein ZHAS_00019375 [Anopheles sinensis]
MWYLLVVTVLVAYCDPTVSTLLYGPCPHFYPNNFERARIKPFENTAGEILYFSNVRFEALFDGKAEIEERYLSYYAIVLEHLDEEQCFRPFQLQFKPSLVGKITYGSSRRGPLTIINTVVLAVHEKNYLLAFSCVQLGHTKLEYVWIFGRSGRFGVGLQKVRQMFEPWLANISTPLQDLRRSHHELPFCSSIFWPAVAGGLAGVVALLSITGGIVCWKKHKQILQLRRSSCAEFPMEEMYHPAEEQIDDERRRDITSARTIAVMHGVVI